MGGIAFLVLNRANDACPSVPRQAERPDVTLAGPNTHSKKPAERKLGGLFFVDLVAGARSHRELTLPPVAI